ncbi:MAG: aminotransferase class V-fold PLP-dependent enzyme [Deltaproteobacteria bacterium]|jgi:selenocysteine lyase/cysteine desulfurase|nr:aminotransferase class V-fold PLP-dependent enzyme [Deltaproteobacteria bacterium]
MGTTEGLDLAAQAFAKPRLVPGGEILLTGIGHHADIVTWQLVAEETWTLIRVQPLGYARAIPPPASQPGSWAPGPGWPS